jgi:sulfur-oxidizing protein SoxZ
MMSDPMRIRAIEKDGTVDVKVLMKHDMESGFRKDASGSLVPAWHITNLTAKVGDKVVFAAEFGPAVSKDPFLNFKFKGASKGEKIVIHWVDNHADTRTDQTTIA